MTLAVTLAVTIMDVTRYYGGQPVALHPYWFSVLLGTRQGILHHEWPPQAWILHSILSLVGVT